MTTHEHRKPKAPYCWQEKNNTRHIRSLVKSGAIKKSEGRNMLDVFRAITEMLSDNASGSDLTGTNLAKRLGSYALMGTSTVKKTLNLMEENKIISIKQIRDEETGRYGDAHLELLSPPQRGLDLIETAEQNPPAGGDSGDGQPDSGCPDSGCPDSGYPDDGKTRSGNSGPPIEENSKPVEEAVSEEERGNPKPRVLKTRERGSGLPVVPQPKRSPEEFHQAVEQILTHLSELTGRPFDPRTAETHDLRARLLEGANVEHCLLLVEHRVALWLEDLRMTGYLRPETLFAKRHYASYLQLAREWDRAGRPVVNKPQTSRPTLNEKGHRDSERVAPSGERRERMLERWKELSQ